MARMTKAQQKEIISTYGEFLQDRAVLSEITTVEVRGEPAYSFSLRSGAPTTVVGRENLALFILAVWEGYSAAKEVFCFEDDGEYLTSY
jgi:hypothetical protein